MCVSSVEHGRHGDVLLMKNSTNQESHARNEKVSLTEDNMRCFVTFYVPPHRRKIRHRVDRSVLYDKNTLNHIAGEDNNSIQFYRRDIIT